MLTHESNIQKDLAIRSIKYLELLASIKTLPLILKPYKPQAFAETRKKTNDG